jgi:hypothetical protein
MAHLNLKRPYVHPNGAVTYSSRTRSIGRVRIVNCPCDDGHRRTVHILFDQDPFHTPARVRVRGRTVSGYIDHLILLSEGPRFHALAGGKNALLIDSSPYRDEEVMAQMILGKRQGDPPAKRLRRLFRADFPVDERDFREPHPILRALRWHVDRATSNIRHHLARMGLRIVRALGEQP